MITEKDLREAIAECQAQTNPNANTCVKLAAYYTILREMTPGYSFSGYDSETDFARMISGRDIDEIIPIMDELMTALQVVNPRLYAGVMRKLRGG